MPSDCFAGVAILRNKTILLQMKIIAYYLLLAGLTAAFFSCKKSKEASAPVVNPPVAGELVYTGYSDTALSIGRKGMAAVAWGNKIFFAGGMIETAAPSGPSQRTTSDKIDIYDVQTGKWSSAKLSHPSVYLAAAAAGSKVIFAGGADGDGHPWDSADIYDTLTGQIKTDKLSVGRYLLAAAATGNKIVFAGGCIVRPSAAVDIYDVQTGQWTTSALPDALYNLAGAAAGNTMVFAGGVNSSAAIVSDADIYDVQKGTWTKASLSEARMGLSAAAAGNKIVFGGGTTKMFAGSAAVDVYDVQSGTWSTAALNTPRILMAAAGIGDKVVFAGGSTSYEGPTNTVEVYDIKTGKIIPVSYLLKEKRVEAAAAATANKLLVAGGNLQVSIGASTNYTNYRTVDFFEWK